MVYVTWRLLGTDPIRSNDLTRRISAAAFNVADISASSDQTQTICDVKDPSVSPALPERLLRYYLHCLILMARHYRRLLLKCGDGLSDAVQHKLCDQNCSHNLHHFFHALSPVKPLQTALLSTSVRLEALALETVTAP